MKPKPRVRPVGHKQVRRNNMTTRERERERENGITELSEAEIDTLGDKELEMDDPSLFALPGESWLETVIPLALNHMQTLAQCDVNIKANEDVNKQETERLINVRTVSLKALTRIRRLCPDAIEGAKTLAKEQAREARKIRDKMGKA